MALAIMALSSVLGARTGYFHASYFLGIKEPTLTIIAFSLITLACLSGVAAWSAPRTSGSR